MSGEERRLKMEEVSLRKGVSRHDYIPLEGDKVRIRMFVGTLQTRDFTVDTRAARTYYRADLDQGYKREER